MTKAVQQPLTGYYKRDLEMRSTTLISSLIALQEAAARRYLVLNALVLPDEPSLQQAIDVEKNSTSDVIYALARLGLSATSAFEAGPTNSPSFAFGWMRGNWKPENQGENLRTFLTLQQSDMRPRPSLSEPLFGKPHIPKLLDPELLKEMCHLPPEKLRRRMGDRRYFRHFATQLANLFDTAEQAIQLRKDIDAAMSQATDSEKAVAAMVRRGIEARGSHAKRQLLGSLPSDNARGAIVVERDALSENSYQSRDRIDAITTTSRSLDLYAIRQRTLGAILGVLEIPGGALGDGFIRRIGDAAEYSIPNFEELVGPHVPRAIRDWARTEEFALWSQKDSSIPASVVAHILTEKIQQRSGVAPRSDIENSGSSPLLIDSKQRVVTWGPPGK